MKIETRFNVGDAVWFMQNNKPDTSKVIAIKVEANRSITAVHCVIDYYGVEESMYEKYLFATKEELIASL